jgi:LPXTG-site transpeptidase (sortase) family protein
MFGRQGFIGTVLLVVGLTGFAATLALSRAPVAVLEPVVDIFDRPAQAEVVVQPPNANAITRLVITSIDLDTPVSPAPLVDHDGVKTWEVPKFVAGHAEGSAAAGETGNAILLGHVTSLTLGNVFEHLHAVSTGDLVELYSAETRYLYRVSDVRDVARTETEVLDPTEDPAVTLITCSGAWLPTVWDYSQRLIVRGELIH